MRITLTTPDDRIFEVNSDKIDALEQAQAGEWAPGTNTIVFYGIPTIRQGVKETIDQIHKLEGAKNEEKASIHRAH